MPGPAIRRGALSYPPTRKQATRWEVSYTTSRPVRIVRGGFPTHPMGHIPTGCRLRKVKNVAIRWQQTTFQLACGLLGVASAATAIAGSPPMAPGLAPRAPQVMLYVSHNIGGGSGGFSKPTFGLRVRQVRQASNNGDPEATGEAFSHRDLLDWQMEAHHDLRVVLGHRVTYDVTHRAFGAPGHRSSLAVTAPGIRNAAATSVDKALAARATGAAGSQRLNPGQEGFEGSDSRMAAFPRSAFRNSSPGDSVFREIATAAVSTLNPNRVTARVAAPPRAGVARPSGQRPNGPRD